MCNDAYMSNAHSDRGHDRFSFGLPDRLGKALDVAEPRVSAQEMADYLGVSRTTISNYTNGRTPVKKQTLRLWALRTGAPLKWLETGEMPRDSGPSGGGDNLQFRFSQANARITSLLTAA